jgi:ADP-ribosylglycohydrolase
MDFATGIQKILLQAGDADTNGAVAGAMMGCKLGYKGLPREWVEGLTHFEWLKGKADLLVRLMGLD